MTELYPFFIVLLAGLFFSEVFRRFHFPWVIALIAGGMAIGPHGFDVFTPNSTIEFLGEVGLVFLMFMAGLETKLSSFKNNTKPLLIVALSNSLIPFLAGFIGAQLFGYGLQTALFVGTIFISSSIAAIVPTLQATGLLNARLGKNIVAVTIIEDITSLVLLSVLLQFTTASSSLPLPVFLGLLFLTLFVLRWIIPKIRWFFHTHIVDPSDIFQQELRSIFFIMIGTVVIFELLGMHSIIAGFFAGLVLAGSVSTELMKEKLRAISYGLFVPIFFIVVGTKTDLTVFSDAGAVLPLAMVIVLGSMLSKYWSGYAGARIAGYSNLKARLIGSATMPQLSTTLAVAFTGFELGILDTKLITAMVILTIISTFVSPMMMKRYYGQIKRNLAKAAKAGLNKEPSAAPSVSVE